MSTKDKLLTTTQLSKLLNANRRTILNFAQKGMPHYRVGDKFIRYDITEVKQWLREQQIVVESVEEK